MKEYEVSIVETLKKTVTVEAESPEDAKYQVQKAWGKGEYILDADDFSGLEFELSPYQVDMPYHEMTKLFRAAERAKQSVNGYIVFTADSFEKPYAEDARTYGVSSNNKAFQEGMGGYSIYGSSLDGTDPCVRLERYMAVEKGGKDGWKIRALLYDERRCGADQTSASSQTGQGTLNGIRLKFVTFLQKPKKLYLKL